MKTKSHKLIKKKKSSKPKLELLRLHKNSWVQKRMRIIYMGRIRKMMNRASN